MTIYIAALCRMNDGELVPHDSVTIETDSAADALEKAKHWALTIEGYDEAWLQVLCDGRGLETIKPGSLNPTGRMARKGDVRVH